MIVNTAAIAASDLDTLAVVLPQSHAVTSAWVEGVGAVALLLDTASGYRVSLALGHNVEGWEAVVDHDGEQTPLPDGPGADATVYDVARWVERVVDAYDAAHDIHNAFQRVHSTLADAYGRWLDVRPSDAEVLLDGDYPFQRSLDEVVAEVGAYVEALEKRLFGGER